MALTRTVKRAAAAGLGAVAIAAALPAGIANAAVPCTVTAGNLVRHWPSYNATVANSIQTGGTFQWTGLVSGEWAQGNRPGLPNGWFPRSSLQC
ncbi:MAG TPA: hypothetical protein VD813_16225 [Pseudonocardia sp.]|nr:hypothetical protein [Pseudonocardia sp.]